MKKSALLTAGLLILLTVQPCVSQTQVGVIGGINFSNINSNDEDWIEYGRTAYGFGFVLERKVNDHVAIRIVPKYLKKDGAALDGPVRYVLKRSYLEIPVQLKFSIAQNSGLYISVGPSIGILLDSELGGRYGAEPMNADMQNLTKSIEFGLSIGAGFSKKIGNVTMFFETNYDLGLSNTAKEGSTTVFYGRDKSETGTFGPGVDIKTRGIKVMTGFMFPLSK